MSKVIWYLHHYAGSPERGMSFRPYYLAKYFEESGFNCHIITASFHHLHKHHDSQKKSVLAKSIEGVKFIFLKTPQYKKNGLKRIINMFFFGWRLRWHKRKIVKITGKPDIIICSSSHLFHFPIAAKLSHRYKAKLIFEIRDLWPLSLIELLNQSSKNPLIKYMSYIERRAYIEADTIVSLLPNALAYIESLQIKTKNYCYIPNGTEPNLLNTNVSNYEELDTLKRKGYFLLGYAGAIGFPNALDNLVMAIKQLNKLNLKLCCIIMGDGIQRPIIEKMIDDEGVDNIKLYEQTSKERSVLFLTKMDALYIGWRNLPIYQYGISANKIYDYLLSSVPIIHSCSSFNDPVKESGCGISVPADNVDEIANAIVRMYHLDRKSRDQMGANGKDYVIKNFSYSKLALEYTGLFE
jgi:glycosyltransferase involved in cell wall biosynthesis